MYKNNPQLKELADTIDIDHTFPPNIVINRYFDLIDDKLKTLKADTAGSVYLSDDLRNKLNTLTEETDRYLKGIRLNDQILGKNVNLYDLSKNNIDKLQNAIDKGLSYMDYHSDPLNYPTLTKIDEKTVSPKLERMTISSKALTSRGTSVEDAKQLDDRSDFIKRLDPENSIVQSLDHDRSLVFSNFSRAQPSSFEVGRQKN